MDGAVVAAVAEGRYLNPQGNAIKRNLKKKEEETLKMTASSFG